MECNMVVRIAFAISGILFAAIVITTSADEVKDLKDFPEHSLQNGNEDYKLWFSPPGSLYKEIYVFNVTNPHAILAQGAKPSLQELGPYVFRVYREKIIVVNGTNKESISYKDQKRYVFDPKISKGRLNDVATILNVPLISLASNTRNIKILELQALNNIIRMQKIGVFVTKRIDQILFSGYKDDLFIFLAKTSGRELLPNGTFGLFYGKNNSDEGVFTVNRGINGSRKKFLKIISWEGLDKLPYWGGDYCNKISGTDGRRFQPSLTKESTLTFFSTDLSRSVYLNFEDDVSTRATIYRFAPPVSLLASSDLYPENECFCEEEPCLESGLLNLTKSSRGTPIIASFPHFYQAAGTYANQVIGLSPSKYQHGSFFDVHPNTGTVLRSKWRLQTNIVLQPFPHLQIFKNVPQKIIFPLVWTSENTFNEFENCNSDDLHWGLEPDAIAAGASGALMLLLSL